MRPALVFGFAAAVAADPVRPKLPQQWTAIEVDDIQINQGGVEKDGEVCCPQDSPNCKIQTAHQSDMFHFDFPNNRTRTGDLGEENAIVSIYSPVNKEMQVSANNTCMEYCPLPFDMEPFGLDDSATYVGHTTFKGQSVDQWSWTEYVFPKFHLIPMEQVNFFLSFDTPPVPVREQDIIEPLGQNLGTENQTWSQFKAGAPPASAFKVLGMDTCPMSPNCQQQARMRHRMKARDFKNMAFYRYPHLVIGKMGMDLKGMTTVV